MSDRFAEIADALLMRARRKAEDKNRQVAVFGEMVFMGHRLHHRTGDARVPDSGTPGALALRIG